MNDYFRVALAPLAGFAWIATGLSGGVLARPSEQQPAGKAIIERSLDTYDQARSIQATARVSLSEKGGKKNGFLLVSTKIDNAPSGAVARSTVEVEEHPARSDDGRFSGGKWKTVDNGKQFFAIYPSQKAYTVESHRPDRFSNLFRRFLRQVLVAGTRYRVSAATFGGEPASVVIATHKSKVAFRCVIDKATSTLRKVDVTDTHGNSLASISVSELVLDAALPPSTFEPPIEGYKRIPLAEIKSRDAH